MLYGAALRGVCSFTDIQKMKRLPKKIRSAISDIEVIDPQEGKPTLMRAQPISIMAPDVPDDRLPNPAWPAATYQDLHPITYKKAKAWLLSIADDEVPSIDALAIHLGMSRNRLDRMRQANGDLDELCHIIDTAARERLRIIALRGDVVPGVAVLVMKHLGFVDRVDITSKGEQMNAPPLTDEQRKLLSVPPGL